MAKNDVETSKTIDTVDYAIRWRPDFRYVNNKFIKVPLNNFKSTEPSVTDKEAYRVSLASLRAEMSAQGTGNRDVGSYSLKPGEEYDPKSDFSFLNRKDLTIVELDDYIKIMKQQLEEADEKVNEQIKAELAQAELKRQNLSKEQKDSNTEVK